MSEKPKTIIACVGNMLLMDEGFGPYMAQVLTERPVALRHVDEEHADILMGMFKADSVQPDPADQRIPVLDAGTMGMGLLPWIREYDRMVILDIVDFKDPSVLPGSVFVMTPEDMAQNTVLHSLHDLKVADVLANAAFAGYDIDAVCVCVQAENYEPEDFHIGLTPALEKAIPTVLGALMEVLGK